MVGVAGKFKGCNTCRTRRVKCDNTRPDCKKCLDSGRTCGQYERPRVFVVGTVKQRGRVSSHPHRLEMVSKAKKAREKKDIAKAHVARTNGAIVKSEFEGFGTRQLSVQIPLNRVEAWGNTYSITQTSFTNEPSSSSSTLGLSIMDEEFRLRAICLHDSKEHRPQVSPFDPSPSRAWIPSSWFLFIYDFEQRPLSPSSGPVKLEPDLPLPQSYLFQKVMGGTASQVQLHPPAIYASFPEHYFFSRLFRPQLTFHSLTHRQPTFLANNDWCSIPWQEKEKSRMDMLFDILVSIPQVFATGEDLETHPPSITRRSQARKLLDQCTIIDEGLIKWLKSLNGTDKPLLWWESSAEGIASSSFESISAIASPGGRHFEFANSETAELILYYWAALSTFYRAIQHIHAICSADIPVSSSPTMEMREIRPRNDSTTTAATPLSMQCFTPPVQRYEQDPFSAMAWNTNTSIHATTIEQIPPLYTSDIPFYQPDSFASPTGFVPEIPVDFDFVAPSQSFHTTDDFPNYSPATTQFAHQNFYTYETTFVVPATPTFETPNVCLPTSTTFPLPTSTYTIPQTYSTQTQPLSPDPISTPYLSTPNTRHSSAISLGRAQSFSAARSYIHSRSPTPTATALSSAPSSNPSLRNSISNPTSNPTLGEGAGYAATPSPSHIIRSMSYDAATSTGVADASVSMSAFTLESITVPELDQKYCESNVGELASNILRGIPFLISKKESAETWDGGPVVSCAMREALKIFRRQGRMEELEECKKLLGHGIWKSLMDTITGSSGSSEPRMWKEWGAAGNSGSSA